MTAAPALTASPRRLPIKRGVLVYWGVVALLWIGWVALAYWMARYGQWGLVDFRVYHEAAGYFARGASPYFGTGGMYFLYPPLLGQLLIPLAGLDVIAAWHVWFVVNLILLLGTLMLVSRYLPPTGARLLWITPLLFEPILDSIYIGQVTIILLALLTGAWIARREDRPFLTGALIAAAAWLKVYPGLLALYFLWKRDWRVMRGIVIAGVALAFLQIAVSGFDPFVDSFGVVFDLAEGGQSAKASVSSSILGFTTQMFMPSFRVTPLIESPALHTISRLALTAGVVITLAVVTGRRIRVDEVNPSSPPTPSPTQVGSQVSSPRLRGRGDIGVRGQSIDLEYSLAVLTAMLISPTLWASGMPPLLLCFWLTWRAASGRIPRYLIAFALILLTCHSWYMIGYEGTPPLPALVLSFGFYALVTLWGVTVWLLVREQRAGSYTIDGLAKQG